MKMAENSLPPVVTSSRKERGSLPHHARGSPSSPSPRDRIRHAVCACWRRGGFHLSQTATGRRGIGDAPTLELREEDHRRDPCLRQTSVWH